MSPQSTLAYLLSPLRAPEFWLFMGETDIKYKYRRTLLGPFWLTMTNGAYIAMLALVFGALFKTTDPTYVPWVATGVVIWNFIGAVLRESSTVLYEKKGFLLQTGEFKAPQLLYWTLWRNVLVLGHQLPIILVTLVGFHALPGLLHALWLIPGFLLLLAILLPIGLVLALLTARLRDLEPLINTALMILFFVTPLMWQVDQLGTRAWMASWNPVTYMIELVRDPLLGRPVDVRTYEVALGLAAFCWGVAILFYQRYATRLVYWV